VLGQARAPNVNSPQTALVVPNRKAHAAQIGVQKRAVNSMPIKATRARVIG
jgi:hypothetical protein